MTGATPSRYFVQLAALSALWGGSFLMTRVAVQSLGPQVSAGLRIALAAVALTVLMVVLRQRWPRHHWKAMALLGFLAVAGPQLLYSTAAQFLPAGYSALLSATTVLFGAFAAAWMKEEQMTPGKWAGCLLGLAGAALVIRLGPINPSTTVLWGALVCVSAAALSGASTPFLKRATKGLEPLPITAGMHIAAALMLLPGALHELPQARFTWPAVLSVLVLGVGTSGLAYWMFTRIVRHVPPVMALSSSFMSTGFGVFWAVLLLSEPTGLGMLAGGALILLACLLVSGLNPVRWVTAPYSDKA